MLALSATRLAFVTCCLAPFAGAQVEKQKIEGSGLQDGDNFGLAVGLSGDWAVIGAPHADDLASESGAAYLFQRTTAGWQERQRIKAGDPAADAGFGASVWVDGDLLAVGAPGAIVQGMLNVGAIYIFERSGSTWNQTSKLTPGDAAINYGLGYSVCISNNRVIGGAIGEWHAGTHTGAAYVFENNAGSWSQVAKLVANDGAAGDFFGYKVSLRGDVAVAGAIGAYNGIINNVGAAYVYAKQGAQWLQTQKLTPPNPSPTQYYGYALAMNSDSLLVGAMNNHYAIPGGGAVFVYQHPGSTWDQAQVLTPSDVAMGDGFGRSLAVSGSRVVVGSTSLELPPAPGAYYEFIEAAGQWHEIAKFTPSDLIYGDSIGNSCALDGTTALLGEPADDNACPTLLSCDSGSAFFFEIAPGTAQYGSCGASSPCNNTDGHGGCRNSTGFGAVLAACGTNSVAADDLVFEARWLPPSVHAIGFMGRARTSLFLGDGLRVAAPGLGSGLYRLPLQSADTRGVLHYGPGLVALSQGLPQGGKIHPGQPWNFQVWYRDVSGPCGSGTNTTNGVSVVFAP